MFFKRTAPGCPLCRRYFLKDVLSFEQRDNLQIQQNIESTYEGVQSIKVLAADFQAMTLLKIDSLTDIQQRFQRRIHKNLPHSFI